MSMEEFHEAQRAKGSAMILAIGTATPPNCFYQNTFADYYLRVTNGQHMTKVKDKFKRMCEKSMIKKRFLHLTEEILEENPDICAYGAPSLDARQVIVEAEVPKLAKEAAEIAIEEWGQPKSKITHLVFCTSSGTDMPGADYQLTKLLGLNLSIKRFMMYMQGCAGGGTALRLAKDLAENTPGARVLVVCSEITAAFFRGPSDVHWETLLGNALFGDGAGAVLVGSDPLVGIERPIFQLIFATQALVPEGEVFITCKTREIGQVVHLKKGIPKLISKNIEKILEEALEHLDIPDWNSLFWAIHPGGPAILDQIEAKLGLEHGKLRSSRHVLREYGNMLSPSVLFVLDEMRKHSAKEGLASTGEGMDSGILLGFGPGITIETIVLRSVPID